MFPRLWSTCFAIYLKCTQIMRMTSTESITSKPIHFLWAILLWVEEADKETNRINASKLILSGMTIIFVEERLASYEHRQWPLLSIPGAMQRSSRSSNGFLSITWRKFNHLRQLRKVRSLVSSFFMYCQQKSSILQDNHNSVNCLACRSNADFIVNSIANVFYG